VSDLPEITFDEARAGVHYPNPNNVKYAFPVTVPEWAITTIWAHWGAPETVAGPYYLIYDQESGQSLYASDWQTWTNTNVPVPGTIHGWRKAHPVEAYLFTPAEDCQVVTRLRGGHTETAVELKAGESVWIVRQRDGEVQRITPESFLRAYLPAGVAPHV
jgi:hypothetical protein